MENVKGYGHEGKIYVEYRGVRGIITEGLNGGVFVYWHDEKADDIYSAASIKDFKKQIDKRLGSAGR